ncbi:uncharacterized protein LOC107367516 isoform X2 [Tetranychus urticae]|uniref:uncharacterized protein LOC107367516 isoform X2 n=1 Tax=Tetranychus urticae TaxID=32264 RepID=UPI00077BCB58|nr:uncharacterized protein LOC107367516 isoform X2 [Tetranychus urticae]
MTLCRKGNSCFLLSFLLVIVISIPLINGQFFTKTSKSIPRMGRRSEPLSKASILQAIYGQSEATIGSDGLIKDDQEMNLNNPDNQFKDEDESMFKELQDDKEEPEYTSVVIKNLKKVLRAYARNHRNDGLNSIN